MGLTPKIGASLGMDPKMGELWSRLHFGDLWGLTPILGIFQVDPKLGGSFGAEPKLGHLPKPTPKWGSFGADLKWGICGADPIGGSSLPLHFGLKNGEFGAGRRWERRAQQSRQDPKMNGVN